MRKGLIQKWRSTSGIHNKKDLKSSLLSQNQPVSDDHTSSLDDDDDQSSDSLGSLNALLVPQSRGWKILRRHLREGTLLLSANGEDETCRRRSRQSVRQEIVKEFHDGMHFSIRFCVSTIVAYLVLSIAMYSCVLEPNWTFIDSCYFAVSTFTTLGYGDLAPTNTASVMFTCFYALTGVAFLGLTLGILGNEIIQKHDILVDQVDADNQQEVLALFGTLPEEHRSSHSSVTNAFPHGASEQTYLRGTRAAFSSGGAWNWQRFSWLCVVTLVLVSFIAYKSGWDVASTVYFIIVTSCTIGYGDLAPSTQMERLAAVVYIPLACLIMGHWLGYVANTIIERQSAKFRKKRRLEHRELTQDDLDAMDATGNGTVTWAEFLEFMLLAMEKVDYDLLVELQNYFQQLDVDQTGELSRGDLAEAARRKLKCARKKLELAAYKRRVINQGKFGRGGRHPRPSSIKEMMQMTIRNLNESIFNFRDSDDDPVDQRHRMQGRRSMYLPQRASCMVQARNTFLSSRDIATCPRRSFHSSYGSLRNVYLVPDALKESYRLGPNHHQVRKTTNIDDIDEEAPA